MTMQLYISPNYSEHEEFITISKSGFFFSAEFIEKNNLRLNQYCQFFTSSENDYKFGVSFSKDKKEGSFKLMNNTLTIVKLLELKIVNNTKLASILTIFRGVCGF